MYLQKVLPDLCEAGDDGQHGSSVVADIAVLQAISKRVHYGFFVAESKFLSQTEEYTRLIHARDEAGLMALLTHAAVEEKVLRRVRLKASTFGLEIEAPPPRVSQTPWCAAAGGASGGASRRFDPELIVRLYREHVIPLTKVAEVGRPCPNPDRKV
jgi:chorismate mutase